jgi:hypothetical protein
MIGMPCFTFTAGTELSTAAKPPVRVGGVRPLMFSAAVTLFLRPCP